MQFNIHAAKTQFSRLISAVEAGETVIISRHGKPVAQVTKLPEKKPFPFGILAAAGPVPEGFFDPLPEDELALWEGGAPDDEDLTPAGRGK